MDHDDYDDGPPPPDEEAEDFRNFDPDTYLRKRGRGTSGTFSESNSTDENAEDFEKFDPDAYLRKRRAERGQQPIGSASSYPVDVEPPSRRRKSVADDSEAIPDVGAAAGLGAGIIGMFGSREATRLNVEILRHGSPLIRAALIGLGCAIVLMLTGVCVLGFLLATAIARR
jgi:hypothetical protein